jgi:hypothetical protein
MSARGSFKIARRSGAAGAPVFDACLDPILSGDRRVRRILESLRSEIVEGGGGKNLRIRRVFQTPREIYRLEFELPELGYQRTTLLDRDALEELLEADDVRALVDPAARGRSALEF